jgi:hypothetical protein
VAVCANQNKYLKPSWPGTVTWFPVGVVQDSLQINTPVPTTFYAYDAFSCIKDTFDVSILPLANCASTGIFNNEMNNEVMIYPNVLSGRNIEVSINYIPEFFISEINFYDVSGKKFPAGEINRVNNGLLKVHMKDLKPGVYFVEMIVNDTKKAFKKIIITD